MQLVKILSSCSDSVLAQAIIDSYKEVEHNYFIKAWKTSELDAGHFVEAVRRLIELKLQGKYTAIGKALPNFNEGTLKQYENATGEESYRIFIPRALYSVYTIRNKRGVGHLSIIKPNKIDATLILYTCKWVLAEIIRINSTYALEETEKLIDEVIQRNVEGIWEHGEIKRILASGLKVAEQVAILLYERNMTDTALFKVIEPKTMKYLVQVLKKMHGDRLIEYKSDKECVITPKGSKFAEEILAKIHV